MHRIHLGLEQKQMKALIGPLSFLIFKPLLTFLFLNVIFHFHLSSNICMLLTIFQRFDELVFHYVGECFVCFENSATLILTKNVYMQMMYQEDFSQIGVHPIFKEM